ncbi:MAG TPA: nitroreductase [candidate division Zixibacteria bacterium]|nr:nitroreductase [candidate division Zixibacteria bacterium]
MDVAAAIEARRAYRSLDPAEITRELVGDLARHAGLAASCFNKQPWRFVFVHDRETLGKMPGALKKGNEWARRASMMVAVCTKRELDCAMKDGREYALFDTGMAAAHLILRAVELGLVAHPIAGYEPEEVRSLLGIPDDLTVITLIMVGRHAADIKPELAEAWQVTAEKERPERLPLEKYAFHNRYQT